MKKFLITLLIMCTILFSLTGCAKCISTETSTVQVKVTDEYHRAAYTTMYYSPATHTILLNSHPAVYRITVEYDGVEYYFYDSDTYNKYSDKVGECVNGILQIDKYDNGNVKYDIIDLE